ncbi:helix-turn-helix domain-containing protein [Actinomadura sp. 6N118]|uniref:helix-turn-helix domain-containing protein n=1 Tax=Actinomadura sp. 6N118 TaxID=3375151 RepID=UPI0037BD72D0
MDDFASFAAGLSVKARVCEHSGSLYGVEVRLAPWAAFTLLGVDMYELADSYIEAGLLLGDRANRLIDGLVALPGWEQRFDLLDDVLAGWIGHGHAWSPRVAWALNELRRRSGTVSIRELAEGVGWRRRQLEYRFREQIGLSPKQTARLFRFRHAAQLLTSGHTPLQTALMCGFSDQAHLTREFSSIAGLTPARFRAQTRGDADAVSLAEQATRHVRSMALTT